jgi:hypothetical protein
MSISLTTGGVQLLFSPPQSDDPDPITLQTLDVETMSLDPLRVDIILSDGLNFSRATLAKQLHKLVHSVEL